MGYSSYAQIGIGTTTPDESSALDIRLANKGVLISRIALTGTTDNTTIPSAANSLAVYNTATINDITPGYYYWNDNVWNRLMTLSDVAVNSWLENSTSLPAKENTDDIYQMGNVGIGTKAVSTDSDPTKNIALNVEGAVRIGKNHIGATGQYSMAFGYGNSAEAGYSTVIGNSNKIREGENSSILGGKDNEIKNGAIGVVIGNGFNNTIEEGSMYSVIAGGERNKLWSFGTVIGGGRFNEVSGNYSTISGGGLNSIMSSYSTVAGGSFNRTQGANSTVSGGLFNYTTGDNSVVSGGINNAAFSFGEWTGGVYSEIYTPLSTTEWKASDRIFAIGNGINEGIRSNALTILKNGNAGFGNEARVPTERIDVGDGKVRIRDINSLTGAQTDKIVVADSTGILKTIDRTIFEGWGLTGNAGAVDGSKDKMLSVRYTDLITPMIKGMQELSEQNNKLEKENKQQNDKINQLQFELKEIKSWIEQIKESSKQK